MKNMEPVILDVIGIIEEGRKKAYQAINTSMVEAYWRAGKRIVEDELQGRERAEYGRSIIKKLSEALTKRFGRGYSMSSLYDFKKFYLTFSDEAIFHKLCGKLSWSHNRLLMRVSNEKARDYYSQETIAQNWGVETLERNINTITPCFISLSLNHIIRDVNSVEELHFTTISSTKTQ